MAKELSAVQLRINTMKGIVANENIIKRAKDVLGREAGTFLASCLDLYSSNLTDCEPSAVMAQCMKAAALHLPVSNSLGFAYIVPYKGNPTFMIGYKGLIQLAQRTGQYKYINADMVYEGETVTNNRISGMVEISGEPVSDKVIGYFAYFKLLNGFEKCIYWTRDRVTSHAKKYSKAFNNSNAPWQTSFDAMALKTVIRQLISKYGIMSIEFANAITQDNEDEVEAEVNQNANGEALVLPSGDATVEQAEEPPKEQPQVQMPEQKDGEPDF